MIGGILALIHTVYLSDVIYEFMMILFEDDATWNEELTLESIFNRLIHLLFTVPN